MNWCRWVGVVGGDEGATQHTWVQGVVTGVLVSHVSQTKNKAKTDKKEMGRKLVENLMCTVQGACHPSFFSSGQWRSCKDCQLPTTR